MYVVDLSGTEQYSVGMRVYPIGLGLWDRSRQPKASAARSFSSEHLLRTIRVGRLHFADRSVTVPVPILCLPPSHWSLNHGLRPS